MRKFIILTFFLLAVYPSFSQQEKKLDSLRLVAQNATNDSVLVDTYHKMSFIYNNIVPDSGLYYAWKCHDLSLKNGFKEQLTTAYSQIGFAHAIKSSLDTAVYYWAKAADGYGDLDNYHRQVLVLNNAGGQLVHAGKYDKALVYLEKAKSIAERNNFDDLLSDSYNNYALIDDYKGNYDKAHRLYRKALTYADSSGLESQRMTTLNNIGVMFYYMGDFEKAIPYFHKSIPFWKKENKLNRLSQAYKNLGVSYDELNEIDSSLYYHKLTLDVDIQLGDRYNQGKDYHNIGVVYAKLNQDKEALAHLLLAEKLKEESNILESIGNTYHHLAKLYLKAQNYSLAEHYLQKNKQAALKIESKEQLKDNSLLFTQYYKERGDFKNALTYQQEYQTLKDTLYEVEKVKAINDIETKYKTKEKEQKAKLLAQKLTIEETKSAKKTAYLLLSLFALLSAILLASIFYRKNKLKAIQNKSLEQHIKHLQTVSKGLVHHTNGQFTLTRFFIQQKKKQAKEGDISTALQDIQNWINSLSTINKHLAKSKGQSLQNSITDIADNLKYGANTLVGKDLKLEFSVPPLIAIPNNTVYLGMIVNELMTNSIKYAFDKQTNPKIILKVIPLDEKMISLVYQDNGVGHKNHTPSSGKGMGIIIDMIEQLFGTFEVNTGDGFQLKATFPKFLEQ